MADIELEHLIKMVNQIASNVALGDDDDVRVRSVAAHLEKFWAPSMRKKITSYAVNDGDRLQHTVLKALKLLRSQVQTDT